MAQAKRIKYPVKIDQNTVERSLEVLRAANQDFAGLQLILDKVKMLREKYNLDCEILMHSDMSVEVVPIGQNKTLH